MGHLSKASLEGLVAFNDALRNSFPDRKFNIVVNSEHGQLQRIITNYRHRSNAPDLVVMGTQGASGLKEVLVGSNTAAVIKHCGVPVLAVPENAKYKGVKNVVIADDAGPIDADALEVLMNIVMDNKAELIVTRVVNEKTSADDGGTSKMMELVKDLPHSTVFLSGEDVTQALEEQVERCKAELVAVVHRKLGVFDRIFHRSTAAKLSMHTHTPMLVLQQGSSN
jgi:nucleotide-binding universal stress UspA family protein